MKEQLLQRWQQLAPREQWVIRSIGWVLGFALLWSVAIAPAKLSLQRSITTQQQLDHQLIAMQQLAQVAQQLQAQTTIPTEQSWKSLQSVSAEVHGIEIRQQTRRVLVQLTNVDHAQLARWLVQARQQAQIMVQEAHITPSEKGWSGEMTLLLPGKDKP